MVLSQNEHVCYKDNLIKTLQFENESLSIELKALETLNSEMHKHVLSIFTHAQTSSEPQTNPLLSENGDTTENVPEKDESTEKVVTETENSADVTNSEQNTVCTIISLYCYRDSTKNDIVRFLIERW